LNRVALRDDPPALALRGIAMAQLGELVRAQALLRAAARAFGAREPLARARCVVAEAEVALATRDLAWPPARLDAALATLEARGDRFNAAHARCLRIRRLLLLGRLDDAEHALARVDIATLPHALRTVHALIAAGIALRRLRARDARAALAQAMQAAAQARIPARAAEAETALAQLELPAARLLADGGERVLRLEDVETLLESDALVVDACRYVVQRRGDNVLLATRPLLFTLVRALAEAWPQDAPRAALAA